MPAVSRPWGVAAGSAAGTRGADTVPAPGLHAVARVAWTWGLMDLQVGCEEGCAG